MFVSKQINSDTKDHHSAILLISNVLAIRLAMDLMVLTAYIHISSKLKSFNHIFPDPLLEIYSVPTVTDFLYGHMWLGRTYGELY